MRVAAERMGVTPAAVSKACLELESIVGQQLFHRTPNGLVATPACLRILDSGRRINAELSSLDNDLKGEGIVLSGMIRIGFQAPILQRVAARTIARLKADHPNLTIIFDYGMREQLIHGLLANRYDLVLADLLSLEHRSRLMAKTLHHDHSVVASLTNVALPRAEAHDWAALLDRPWIIPSKGLAMRERFDHVLASNGLSLPRNRIEINSPIESLELFKLTGTLMFTTASAIDRLGPYCDARAEKTVIPRFEMKLGLIWAKDTRLSPAVIHMRDSIVSAAANIKDLYYR